MQVQLQMHIHTSKHGNVKQLNHRSLPNKINAYEYSQHDRLTHKLKMESN